MRFGPTERHIERRAEHERQGDQLATLQQVRSYWAKVDQARLFMADRARDITSDPDDIPHLTAEAEATGKTVYAVAKAILDKHRAWAKRDAKVEAQRVKRKKELL